MMGARVDSKPRGRCIYNWQYCRRRCGAFLGRRPSGPCQEDLGAALPYGSLSRANAFHSSLLAARSRLFPVVCGICACRLHAPPAAPPPPPVEVGVVEVSRASCRSRSSIRRSCTARARSRCARASRASCSSAATRKARASPPATSCSASTPTRSAPTSRARARSSASASESQSGAPRARPDRAAVRPEAREPARPRHRARGFRECGGRGGGRGAALRTAELALSYTEVRAPIDGLTSREVRSEGSL